MLPRASFEPRSRVKSSRVIRQIRRRVGYTDSVQRDSLSIGVVGAGSAGTASALLLARAGHRVSIFERVAQPGPVGAGITLQPTGQAVLAQLGLLEEIERHATRVEATRESL